MTNDIVEVAYLGDQRLFLCFADDRAGEVDLAPLLQFTGSSSDCATSDCAV